jgi:hypothetical protein
MKKSIFATLFILISISFSFSQERLTPELLWKLGRVSDVQLSPDGKTVLFGITNPS